VSFLPLNYKSIVFCQSAAGFWNETLLELMSLESVEELVEKQISEEVKQLKIEALLTLAALKILKTHFKDNIKEWKLVAAKGARFLKNAGLPIDQLLEVVVAELNT
jgi:hypothetical protein